jgi:hypothetical protein
MSEPSDHPPYRYTAAMAARIEMAWQDRWEREGTFHTPNPTGPLGGGFDSVARHLTGSERRQVVDAHRLAYRSDAVAEAPPWL